MMQFINWNVHKLKVMQLKPLFSGGKIITKYFNLTLFR